MMLILSLLVGISSAAADEPGTPNAAAKVRVGVYDNRAIAVAYAASKFNPVAEKMKEFKQAKDAGKTDRVKELEAWGQRLQRQLHRQGFGRAPVDDLLAHVKDKLPEIARQSNVVAISWQINFSTPNVEVVDVTDAIVKLFDPSEKTLKTIEQLKKQPAVDLDDLK